MSENEDAREEDTAADEGQPIEGDIASEVAAAVPSDADANDAIGDATEDAPILPPEELRAIVEALIFASPQPLAPRQLGQVLTEVPPEAWKAAVDELRSEYERDGRGLRLAEIAGGYQITTRPEYNDWLRALLDPKSSTRLSIQALETLAVIAYKQPVTQPEVIELRGVKSGGVLKTLLEKRLIRIVGRKEVVGRPMLYGTTKNFLLHFGLQGLSELPEIEEFAEVLGEDVDVAGLKRAIETPSPVEEPLSEDEIAAGRQAELDLEAEGEMATGETDTADTGQSGADQPDDANEPDADESDDDDDDDDDEAREG